MPYTLDNIRLFGLYGLKFFDFVTEGDAMYIDFGKNVVLAMITLFLACGVVGYLLGSMNFAIIISRLKYRDDVRKYGSGNAGMTNMMRTYGRAAGIVTFVCDILKAVVAVYLGWFALGEAGGHFAGLCCMLGHCFPIWYKFKGGKGVAVTAAMILCLEPLLFVFVLLVFVVIVAFSRYISLGSIMAALMYPILLGNVYTAVHRIQSPFYFVVLICATLTTVLILFMHRENMQRLLNHTENKFSFKKKGEKKVKESTENIPEEK